MQERKTRLATLMLAVGLSSTAQAALQGRDLDGDTATFEAYYDTALNITWLANANHGAGSTYDDGESTIDGRMTWANAVVWAANLSFTAGINTYDNWRLPIIIDTAEPGCDFAYTGTDCGYNVQTASGGTIYSEMAHMFYITLSNLSFYDSTGLGPQSGYGLANTGPFSNVQTIDYWLGTEYAPNTNLAWDFTMSDGYQEFGFKGNNHYAWAVTDGDVASVPEAEAWMMMLTGLALVGGAARYRSRRNIQ